MVAYLPLFNNFDSPMSFFTEETAQMIIDQIEEYEYVLSKESAIFFVFDFIYKAPAMKAKKKFENLGYDCEIYKENDKIVWSLSVKADLIGEVNYLMETEKTLNQIVKEFKGSYSEYDLLFIPGYKKVSGPRE